MRSGAGGAIFAQTTGVNITKCHFTDNAALTGQFDSGSAGGAIMLEDCYPASITHCDFQNNGAAGYFGAFRLHSSGWCEPLLTCFAVISLQATPPSRPRAREEPST